MIFQNPRGVDHLPKRNRFVPLGAAVGGKDGAAVITLPKAVLEHSETLAVAGIAPTNKMFLSLAPALDADENCPEMLDMVTLSAEPLTDAVIVSATFSQPTRGAIKLNWSAV